MNRRVLAIGAHPDDVEFMMAGTLLMLARAGYEPHIFVVASGSCGSATDDRDAVVRARLSEAQAAAAMLGAQFHRPVTDDLEVLYSLPLLRKMAAVVRQARPHIILTHSPNEYMEDHSNTCRLAVTAAFSRGMRNFITDPETPPVNNSVTLYHALPYGLCDPFGKPVTPDLYVNIADALEMKRKALGCHASQKRWLDESQGLDSYLQAMEDMSREVGEWSERYAAAEGWRRHSHLGFCDLGSDPLCAALGEDVCSA
ncbi:MAG TPA: LmbE family protein [Candidatus Hydrogenedentes bacterium]|nr:LmbE family protein [Candidatus Hydrogenedentota bacterium]